MANERRGAALLAATVTVLLLALAGPATAAPTAPAAPGGCSIGTAKGAGSAVIDGKPVDFDFSVCEKGPAATDTTGRYAPKAGPGGPVQCADLNEHTMAFLYALDAAKPDEGRQILVVVNDGGPKPGDDRIGFTAPKSTRDFRDGCGLGSGPAQQVTREWQPLTSGDITVTLNR